MRHVVRNAQKPIFFAVIVAGTLFSGHVRSANPFLPESVGNPSPSVGTDASQRANEMADKAMYKPVEYANTAIRGPNLVVIPGDIKSTNAEFTQQFGPNNIADFAEIEFGRANFGVLERSDMGPMLQEFQLAYTMGDPEAANKMLQRGKFKTTKWVVKLDILKAEPVAATQQGFDGRALGQLIDIFGRSDRKTQSASTIVGSIKTDEGAGVWIIGMRYKVLNANTTEQVATGYTEEKMEVGAKSSSVLGFSQGAQGSLTLDGMVQRLVQKLVWEIDSKHKGSGEPPPSATRSVPVDEPIAASKTNEPTQPVVDPDTETWQMAHRANTEKAYRAYIDAFPSGQFLVAARIALDALKPSPREPDNTQPQQSSAEMQQKDVEKEEGRLSAATSPECSGSVPISSWNNCMGKVSDSNSGTAYVGHFRNGVRDGQGTYTWASGEKYVGEFKDDRIEGQGTRTWPNGEKYVGLFSNGIIEGQGTYTWPSGETYVGQFKGGIIDGQGTRTWPNGEKYVGQFRNGVIEEQGTYSWPSGEKYIGQFKGGLRHGVGSLYRASGTVLYEGKWVNDRKAIE